MKTLLITGFDPFGGENINPSWETVKRLPDEIGSYRLHKLQIPTRFGVAAEKVLETARMIVPDAIISVGQAGGRKGITPEVVAINLQEASIPDNAGHQPTDTPVAAHGPAAYFSTLPVRRMVESIRETGLPSNLSFSAGAFVCNDVMYTLLHHFQGTQVQCGFIHVPFLPEQAKENVPSLFLDEMVKGITAAIAALE
ncbi:MAG: pyroglutamyl-peptidase I [Clostridia bacterium]|nr:pyroglutamyl-peptidase I [Clostridia bacterium]MBR6753658.1 pyroglutamyl-peptidase I [Clostridia bacterium]